MGVSLLLTYFLQLLVNTVCSFNSTPLWNHSQSTELTSLWCHQGVFSVVSEPPPPHTHTPLGFVYSRILWYKSVTNREHRTVVSFMTHRWKQATTCLLQSFRSLWTGLFHLCLNLFPSEKDSRNAENSLRQQQVPLSSTVVIYLDGCRSKRVAVGQITQTVSNSKSSTSRSSEGSVGFDETNSNCVSFTRRVLSLSKQV